MLVNQKFIADEVGCSQKTVSLYFKNRLLVAEKTREQLDLVVKKYNYFPNAAARSIKNNQFKRVAVVVVQYGTYGLVSQPQLMSFINGAARALGQCGYSLVYEQIFVDPDHLSVDFPELFSMRSVDGIIGIPGGWTPPEVDARVAALELPTVWLNRQISEDGIKSILFDEEAGVTEIAGHLIGQGLKRVAWFGPEYVEDQAVHYSSRVRFETLRDELAKRGGELTLPVFVHCHESLDERCGDIVRHRQEFDALVCYNHQYREAAVGALIGSGEDVRKLKTIHFASSWEYHPRYYDYFDFVLLPEVELGRCGAEYILSRIENKENRKLLMPQPGKLHLGKGFPNA